MRHGELVRGTAPLDKSQKKENGREEIINDMIRENFPELKDMNL